MGVNHLAENKRRRIAREIGLAEHSIVNAYTYSHHHHGDVQPPCWVFTTRQHGHGLYWPRTRTWQMTSECEGHSSFCSNRFTQDNVYLTDEMIKTREQDRVRELECQLKAVPS